MSSGLVDLLYGARWYLILLLGVSYYALQSYRSYTRLSHIKGPWLAQWSILWLIGAVYRQKTHLEFYETYKKYGG
jgi:hypothetical protein